MAAVVVVIVALLLVMAWTVDRRARKRGSKQVSPSELARTIRQAHRTARMRETMNGSIPNDEPRRRGRPRS